MIIIQLIEINLFHVRFEFEFYIIFFKINQKKATTKEKYMFTKTKVQKACLIYTWKKENRDRTHIRTIRFNFERQNTSEISIIISFFSKLCINFCTFVILVLSLVLPEYYAQHHRILVGPLEL
jgi:hypothetical protein